MKTLWKEFKKDLRFIRVQMKKEIRKVGALI